MRDIFVSRKNGNESPDLYAISHIFMNGHGRYFVSLWRTVLCS
jgi:hypothetical protein